MLDASKYGADARLMERDPHGYMFDLVSWSPRRAGDMATQEGITLTEAHWQVIYALRERYREHGPVPARKVGSFLAEATGLKHDRKHLYELFPRGPVCQASRIAGLPVPSGSSDRSFGSVQ